MSPRCSFHPGQCEWIYNPRDAISTVACSEKSTGKIFVYDGRGSNQPLHVFDKMHSSPLSQIRLNPTFRVIVSADKAGMLSGAPWRWDWGSPASDSPPSLSTRSFSCWWRSTPGEAPF